MTVNPAIFGWFISVAFKYTEFAFKLLLTVEKRMPYFFRKDNAFFPFLKLAECVHWIIFSSWIILWPNIWIFGTIFLKFQNVFKSTEKFTWLLKIDKNFQFSWSQLAVFLQTSLELAKYSKCCYYSKTTGNHRIIDLFWHLYSRTKASKMYLVSCFLFFLFLWLTQITVDRLNQNEFLA